MQFIPLDLPLSEISRDECVLAIDMIEEDIRSRDRGATRRISLLIMVELVPEDVIGIEPIHDLRSMFEDFPEELYPE